MDDESLLAILRRVIVEPNVDVHRLVYADRLDELDEHERAEYIRESVLRPDIFRLFEEAPAWSELPAGIVPSWLRGFVCELTCDAATFLAHADELVWHETQKVKCPRCGGTGGCFEWGDPCLTCEVKGVVSRPCPPTAQPIRKVVLTTEPAFLDHGTHFTIQDDPIQERIPAGVMEAVVPDSLGEVCFRYRFSGGIEFEFPSSARGTEAQSDDADGWAEFEHWGGESINSEGA